MTHRKEALLALAGRVEGLSGADREIDAEISLVVGLTKRERRAFDNWNAMRPRDAVPRLERDWLIKFGRPWTASLDAAVTLVGDGARLKIEAMFSDGPNSPVEWWVSIAPGFMVERRRAGPAATAALATTAAALRALASQEE